MVKLNIILIALFMGLFGNAQTVGGVHISQIEAEYVELVGTASILKPFQVSIVVDYGQFGSLKEAKNIGLMDAEGNIAKINGMMGAVNLFAENGWELHSTMLLSVGNKSVYHYIMKKKSYNNSSTLSINNSNDSLRKSVSSTSLKSSSNEPSFLESKTKYQIGQTVYFYKKNQLIESKIIYVDTIGKMCSTGCLKVEYIDVENNNTKTKYITFDKVLLEKP